MKTAPSHSRHTGVWVISALALVLLYMLSAPPVYYALVRQAFDPLPNDLRWALAEGYAAPYDWLKTHTRLSSLLEPYALWWGKRMELPP